jgi:c(7)-type cytochrome triheme protein
MAEAKLSILSRKMKWHLVLLLSFIIFPASAFPQSSGASLFDLPPLPSPETYDEVFMGRNYPKRVMAPVSFSHWEHRVKYTCRVCHYELEFAMKAGDTPIVCDNGLMNGKHCAVCHNGKISFGPREGNTDKCSMCHGSNASSNWAKFKALQNRLPRTKFGDEINWAKALEEGLIKPEDSLSGQKKQIVNIKTLTLEAEMGGISSSIFPHRSHELWLDCSNCHPDLFNIKKKTTATLRMSNMVEGESCGLCHLSVAFPLNDCRRCHPKMKLY